MMQSDAVRAVWPEVPEPSEWLGFLEETRAQNWHTNFGPLARRFEAALQGAYAKGDEVAVSASNATSALSACLIAHRIRGPVLCPAFTFQATACAILGAGCQPVIVDVDGQSGVVTPNALETALKATGARAAMLVAPYGISTDFRPHAAICRKHGARLVIDNAAGLGVLRQSADPARHVDEVYSLHATKPFGIGEGGLIFTAPEYETALRSALNFGIATHGGTGQETAPYWGVNGKLTEVGAAIGLAVLNGMADRVRARQSMAGEWLVALSKLDRVQVFSSQVALSPWQVFPVLFPNESCLLRFMGLMNEAGIETRRYYAPSLGACRGMRSLDDCSNARSLAERALTLPVRSYMSAPDRHSLMARAVSCLTASLA